jgi:hypothetical protein
MKRNEVFYRNEGLNGFFIMHVISKLGFKLIITLQRKMSYFHPFFFDDHEETPIFLCTLTENDHFFHDFFSGIEF